MASLVRKQLDEGGSWQVLSYSVDGTGDTQKPYSMSSKAYVMIPDQNTVDKAKVLMKKVREGSGYLRQMWPDRMTIVVGAFSSIHG